MVNAVARTAACALHLALPSRYLARRLRGRPGGTSRTWVRGGARKPATKQANPLLGLQLL
jgi:hypothetical protein